MKKLLSVIAVCLVFPAVFTVQGQILDMTDMVMYSHNGGPGTTSPGASGYGVILGSSNCINGGSIGSSILVQSTGSASVTGNIYSGGKVILANGNSVTGRITAANTANLTGTIFQAGTSQTLPGNIDVKGNIVIGGGTVSGIVTHPVGTTYTGPSIGANNHTGTPSLPTLPVMPTPIVFPAAGATNYTNTVTLTPGNYGSVTYSGNKTLTLNGPGTYVFSAVQFSSNNCIVYNFQNSSTGVFRVYVHGDANLAKLNASMTNGGSATRIYWEVHGTGATSSSGKDAVYFANGTNGSVKFSGTIYAPYAAISLGAGSGATQYYGALISGTQIILQSNVTFTYSAFINCAGVTANAGADVAFCPGGSASLGAAPVTGTTYSWSPTTGLSSSTISNPTVTSSTPGTLTYTLTITKNGCTSTDQVIRTVYSLPVVSAGTYAAVCVNGSNVTLAGTPSGGTFSGTGVTGNSFNPATAGTGTKTITYTYTNANGCTNSATTTIVVNSLPVVSAGTYAALCVNGSSVTLAGTPAGGTFSGPGVTGNSFNPATAGTGTKTITYTYTNASGCTNSATTTIVVNTLPVVSAGTYAAVCVNGSSLTLAGTPTGGTFSGPGVTGNSFNPATAGTGTKTITYTYTNASGCTNSATTTIVVNTLPVVNAGTYSQVCLSGTSVSLAGTPSGGTFTGNGVTSNSFNPATAGVGTTTITYSYSNGTCSNTATTSIVVNALPNVNAGNDGQLDCSTPTTQLHGSSSTLGVTYSWQGSAGGNVSANGNTTTPTISAHGTFTLTVTIPSTGCSASDVAQVIFDPCIFPGYNPLPTGKTDSIIGMELTSLYSYSQTNGCSNPDLDVFFINDNCQVLVEIVYADGMLQQVMNILTSAPFNCTDFPDQGSGNRLIVTFVDLPDLMALNNLNITYNQTLINHVRPVFRPIPVAGVAYSLGDVSQGSDKARNGFNVDGQGIKVGILSNSYNTIPGNPAQTDVVNDDLPGTGNPFGNTTPVQVIQEYPYGVQTDEGRAMLQIVHDVAPKADLAFASAFISAGNMAAKIRQLQTLGCDVLCDDITYITEPFFRDGMVAEAVNDVTALGASYFTAAGNYGDKSYEAIYTPTAPPTGMLGTAHDFGGGDKFQNVSLTPGSYLLVMQWEDEFYSIDQLPVGTANDLDIYLTYDNGITLFGFNRNNLGGDPIEVMTFTVTQNTTTNVLVTRASGNGAGVHFKYILFKVPAGGFVANEYNQGNSTIVGQANSLGAITCGAVLYSNTPAFGVSPPTKASFSSIGGTLTYGSARNKPDICAPNGGNTTVFLGGPNQDPVLPDAFPNFFGTSAAAPHAAGVGALLLQAKLKYYNQTLTPAQVKTLLTTTATDMYSPGFDYLSGHGLVNADASMRTFAAPTPELVSLDIPNGVTPGNTSFTLTVTADFITTQSQIVFREETLATTYIDEHHLSAIVNTFFGNPPIQVCTPGFAGPDFLDGGCSNILYFASPIKKEVVVTANNKSKKYGEVIPAFTATVTVDGQSLQAANLTLADLGLEDIQFAIPPGTNSMSPVGIYFINPSAGPFDIGFTELYNYTFNTTANNNPGLLTIGKMPLLITPLDKTVLYGDKIDGREIEYSYVYDATNIAPGDQANFLNNLKNIYEPSLVKEVALIDDRDEYNNATLSASDLVNLAFLSGSKGIANGSKGIANGSRAIANSLPFPDTTYVIDLPYQSLVEYNQDGSMADLMDSVLLINGSKGIANGSRGIANSQAIVDGTALVNGSHPIANGSRGIANGSHGIVNGEELDGVSNTNTAVILHETDLDTQENPDSTFQMISINGITGLTAGVHFIIPGAFMSSDFDVSYATGNLHVNPYEIKIDANDASTVYGTSPAYGVVVSGYQYDDAGPVVFTGNLSFTPAPNSQINVGTHTIVPGGISLIQPSNYYITYINGSLTVTPATLTVTANNQNPPCSSLPAFTSSITGYKFTDNFANVFSAGPSYTVLNNLQQPVVGIPPAGTYQIVPAGAQLIAPSNYTVQYANGTLVEPALLTLAATPVNPACNNQTGSVTLVPTGGVSPYNFSGSAATNLAAGTYSFIVTDANGCTATASATITAPSAVTGNTSSTAASCSAPTGTATVIPAGGTPGYSYVWSPGGQTTPTATGLAGGNYSVVISDSHGCTGSATVAVAFTGTAPAAPGAISGPAGACINQTGITFSIAPVSGATSYTWTLPANASGSSTSTSISVNFSGSYNGGNILVRANNYCGSSANTSKSVPKLTVAPATPGAISGPGTVCPLSSSTYSIGAVTNALSYTWTVTGTGLSIGSGQGTISVVVNAAAGFVSGTVTVKAVNCIGNSATVSKTVYGVPPSPFFNNGGNDNPHYGVCAGGTYDFEVDPVLGSATLTWSAPAGAVINDRQGHTGNPLTVTGTDPYGEYEVEITFPAGFVSGTVNVYGSNGCGNGPLASYAVQSKPSTPGAITGQTTGLCNQSGKVYSIAAVPGATSYTWTKPSGTTISGASNGSSITLNYGSTFTGTGTITVKANNGCGSSATSSLNVDAKPAQPGTISGSSSVCKTQTSVPYSIAAVTGATSYTWTISGGATFVGGATGSSVTVKYTTATSSTATLTVKANNACGSSAVRSLSITVNLSCRTAADAFEASGFEFNVYPNPTSEKATVSFVASEGDAVDLGVYNMNGELVAKLLNGTMEQSGDQSVEVDCSLLVKGIYFVNLRIGEALYVNKLVIIK